MSATRGEATLSTLGVERGRARARRDRRARGAVAAAAAAGRAGRRDRPQRTDGTAGLRVRPRRRVALRARDGRRRAGQPAGRRLRLRHGAAVRAGAGRDRARRGQQPLRDRRARRRREPADPARRRRGRALAAGRGRGRLLRLAALASARRPAPRGAFDWNLGAQRLDDRQRDAEQRASSRRRRRSPRACSSTTARRRAPSCASTTARAGTPGPTAFGPPDLDASFEREDLVLAGLAAPRPRPPLAAAERRLLANRPALARTPSTPAATCRSGKASRAPSRCATSRTPPASRTRRIALAAGYQADVPVGSRHLLTAGAELEHETGALGDRSEDLLRPERTNFGVYLQDRVLVGSRAYLTLGARVEHNDSYGTHVVPRAGARLAPARGRGRDDAADERRDAGSRSRASSSRSASRSSRRATRTSTRSAAAPSTWASSSGSSPAGCAPRSRSSTTTTEDQIAYSVVDFTTFEGTYVNLAQTRAQGLELALEARPVPAARAQRPVHASWTARSSRARATSIPSTRSGSRCCAGRGTRARSAPRLSFPRWSAGVTLALVGRAGGQRLRGPRPARRTPATRGSTRACASCWRGRSRRIVVGDNLLDDGVPGGARLSRARPRRARRPAAAPGRRRATVTDERVLARLEQRQGQRLRPPRPARAGRGGRGPAHDDQRGVRPRGDARRAPSRLLRAQAEAVGLPLARGRHPLALPERGVRGGDGAGDATARERGHHGRRLRRPVPRGRAALPRGAHGAARGCGRCSRSGAGRPRALAEEMIALGQQAVLTCVDPRALPRDFAGRAFDAALLARPAARRRPVRRERRVPQLRLGRPDVSPARRGARRARSCERDGFVFADLIPETDAARQCA